METLGSRRMCRRDMYAFIKCFGVFDVENMLGAHDLNVFVAVFEVE